jgi:hypothetical protein
LFLAGENTWSADLRTGAMFIFLKHAGSQTGAPGSVLPSVALNFPPTFWEQNLATTVRKTGWPSDFGLRASFGPRISAFGFMPYHPFTSLLKTILSATTENGRSIATTDVSVVKLNP